LQKAVKTLLDDETSVHDMLEGALIMHSINSW